MKIKLIISFCIGLFIMLSSCDENYLERYPLDEISTMDYWKSANDLELYVNQFYPTAFHVDQNTSLRGNYSADLTSDDVIAVFADERFMGTRVVPGSGGWDYKNIRSLNYFFEHYETVESDFDSYKQFVGEAYFFRAFYYFSLVKEYGDVPLIDKTLFSSSEELYLPKTPRNQVVDFIIEDLDKAIEYMPTGIINGRKRLNSEIAQLFKSRVCLYEGTWEKYHDGDAFAVANADPNKYLNLAVQAAQAVIHSGVYSIHSAGNPKWDYFFFGDNDHGSNQEVMLWKDFDISLGLAHSRQKQIGNGYGGGMGLSKNFIESYLCTNGKPIYLPDGNSNPLYMGDGNLSAETTNRDPRLIQTVFTPGFPIEISGSDTVKFVRAAVELGDIEKNTTGYQFCKALNWDPGQHSLSSGHSGYSGVIIIRYAEVLLNFAEAKAELESITQNDINQSINLLRARVGMPDLVISEIQTDPYWQFPQLTPVINEIRRERRVELILEGFRWDDIARWAAADELVAGRKYIGAKFNAIDYSDLSADNFKLTQDGNFDELRDQIPNGFGFVLGRDYLSPISTEELTLNPSLTQNTGW